MAVESETIVRFTCDLCGASQITSPDPMVPLICSADASAKIAANMGDGRRMVVGMTLCDSCYSILANLIAQLRKRLTAEKKS